MKIELRSWLEDKAGLTNDASDQEAWAAYRALEGDERKEAMAIRSGQTETDEDDNNRADDQLSVADALKLERKQRKEQTAKIRELFDGDFPELERTAIDEEWTPEKASQELLEAIRKDRSDSAGAAPFIHSGSNATRSVEALQGAMLLRSNVSFESKVFNTPQARMLPEWLRDDINSDRKQRTMEAAHQIGNCSMVDVCRYSLAAAGKQVPHDQDEAIRQSFDEGTLQPVFTTNFQSQLLMGYEDAPDTTMPWTGEEDFGNFLQSDLVSMGKMGSLKRHAKGVPADQMDIGATSEPIKLARYDGQYTVDEIDILDDRFGAIEQMSPIEMGASARQLRPDLVYSILLSNPNLTRDDAALFLASFNDYTGAGSAMGIPALKQLVAGMAAVRQRNRPLNLKTRYLLVPTTLMFDSAEASDSQTATTGAGTVREAFLNQLSRLGLMTIPEARLNAAGVIDPRDDSSIAGVDTQWFGIAAPGAGGAKTITVGFRRGTNRAPVVRAYTLDKGQWGIGWDVNMDITATPVDRLAMARSGSSVA